MTHKTRGIILRTIRYGDTSVIATAYTELFGIQTYIVKGIRQQTKKASSKAIYFQPAAILEMVVYRNEFKNLNFIKEYQWGYLYENVLFDVVKNTVAMYIVEMMQHCLKQPEANPDMFYLVQDTLVQLDKGNQAFTGMLPLYFTLHLGGELGFRIQGEYSAQTPVADLMEGQFISEKPEHPYYLDGKAAMITSQLLNLNFYNDLEQFQITRQIKRELMVAYQNYIALHVQDFGVIKSLPILQEILG
ncbi:DNA repair protein RecO [Segetibacter sp. 3557_3]|uniref:DNA repair protein RecO n=1 Tax=Segetibacter sp. 3557_3 TaxID=2547429 RepID=UPI0010589772|nr:DNA repair protein RecO [Segetibacter sp. 3557_3]TDH26253.1 DNA repair protein RecO [Segetibacter sp. 3557_3]